MSDRFLGGTGTSGSSLLTGTSLTSGATLASREVIFTSPTRSTETVVVDVGTQVSKANVVREGFAVPDISFDATRLSEALVVLEEKRPKVVAQSLAPGQKVPRGTEIFLTLAPAATLPGRVITGHHVLLGAASLKETYDRYLSDSSVRGAVASKDSADKLTSDERDKVIAIAAENEIEIVEADPGRDFTAFYTSLRAAYAYGPRS